MQPPSTTSLEAQWHFPHPPREEQRVLMRELDKTRDEDYFTNLEAPVGVGKSPVAMTFAHARGGTVLVPQNILQKQYLRDWPKIPHLKGSKHYMCNNGSKEHPSCQRFHCNSRSDKEDGTCPTCPYIRARDTFRTASEGMTSYAMFFAQLVHTPDHATGRPFILADECFHPHTMIQTEHGRMPIGKIVTRKLAVRVKSYNFKTGQVEYKRVVRWHRNSVQQTYKVLAGNRVMYPTANHMIFTPSGKVRMDTLKVGDYVYTGEAAVTQDQRQVLLGSLLGDACVHLVPSKRKSSKYINKGTRARVTFRHGPKQFRYLLWKYNILRQHVDNAVPELKPAAGFTATSAYFNTRCHLFDTIKPVLVGGRKSPTAAWFDQLTTLGLAVWFMDDGSTGGRNVRLHTEGFTHEESLEIVYQLWRKWGIKATVGRDKKRNLSFVRIGHNHSRLFANMIAEFVPPFMRYKLPAFVPHDPATGLAYTHPVKGRRCIKIHHTDGDWPAYNPSVENQLTKLASEPIAHISPYKTSRTFDIEVEDNHNYFAGNTLVSNSHNLDEAIISAAEISFDETKFHKLTKSLFPKLASRGRDREKLSIEQAKDIMERMYHSICAKLSKDSSDTVENNELALLRDSLSATIPVVDDTNHPWACDIVEAYGNTAKRFWIKPVMPTRFYNQLIKEYYSIVALSATPAPSKVLAALYGVKPRSFAVKSPFPIENRPIYYRPIAKMSYQHLDAGKPKMASAIGNIVKNYPGENGIIHTTSFKLGADLFECFDVPTRKRVILHRSGDNKEQLLEQFYAAAGTGAILMSPSITEGLDLADEKGRFNIIAKVPYPAMGDPWITARRDKLGAWYDWKTSLAMAQASGRTTRHADDWSDTIILDTCFGYFYDSNRDLFPEWFQEALK